MATTETSSEADRGPYSKGRSYLVQNSGFQAVLDSSELNYMKAKLEDAYALEQKGVALSEKQDEKRVSTDQQLQDLASSTITKCGTSKPTTTTP